MFQNSKSWADDDSDEEEFYTVNPPGHLMNEDKQNPVEEEAPPRIARSEIYLKTDQINEILESVAKTEDIPKKWNRGNKAKITKNDTKKNRKKKKQTLHKEIEVKKNTEVFKTISDKNISWSSIVKNDSMDI